MLNKNDYGNVSGTCVSSDSGSFCTKNPLGNANFDGIQKQILSVCIHMVSYMYVESGKA